MRKKKFSLIEEIFKKGKDDYIRQLEGQVGSLKSRLSEYKEGLPVGLKEIANSRRVKIEPEEYRLEDDIKLDDPIHNRINIESTITPIYFHPIVQRLNDVKQLSFAYRRYPSATHTRLSHSLGVATLSEQVLARVFRKNIFYTENSQKQLNISHDIQKKIILMAKVSSLLHDIGHGPFSHNLDRYAGYETTLSYADKVYSVKYIHKYLKETIESCDMDSDEIARIVDQESREQFGYFTSYLLDSYFDVDRMDYLIRDAHFTGVPIGIMNVIAVSDEIVPYYDSSRDVYELAFLPSAYPYLEYFIYCHFKMYTDCYEHTSKVSKERFLLKVTDYFVKEYGKEILEDIMLLTDRELLALFLINSDPTKNNYRLC